MIAELKKSLAECHVKAGDKTVQFLMEATPMYLITRAKEEMWAASSDNDPQVTVKQLTLSIQLLNIARCKLYAAYKQGTCSARYDAGQGSERLCTKPFGHEGEHGQI